MKTYEKLISDPIAREEGLLGFWRSHKTFETSLERTKGGPRYVFYEGPPTANGKPHFGHLIPRVYKDLFPRYKTMQGFYVVRKGGWDTHGLPVELEVEKEIGVNSKPEIEAYGVERFVERCKASVWRYKADWEHMIERMGFWIDLENAYVTCSDDYIESVWWQLAQMFSRGLLYRGHKVLPYCSRCGTGLSSHEVAQGYRRVKDPSIVVRMTIVEDEDAVYKQEVKGKTSLLTWTTTPWTLPANVALAIAAHESYVEVEQHNERLILAKALLGKVLDGEYRVMQEYLGSDLVGLRYDPPYRLIDAEGAYRVQAADFVNMEEGTGIVHTAPAFGEDDYRLGQEQNLPFFQPVDLAGAFTEDFPLCSGAFVKDADSTIIEDLRGRGLLYRFTPYEHDYPFCWRCETPLLYFAMDSWYIQTTAVKEQLIANNHAVRWHPEHVGEGRLGDFLVNLKDWALSRDRYWGTPLNLWICAQCGVIQVVESRAELVKRACDPELARTVELHRPYIDRVELVCPECSGTMRRVPHVIDAWFDSGSMHTAQWHYPFENKQRFKDSFPADFICEAMEQTRGWFYTLLATSTILYDTPAYRNCIATGLGLDEQGLKMSKSKGNIIDPWDLINAYGADCLRWYFYSASAPWKSKRLGEVDVKEPLYHFLDTLRNAYDFFSLYASIDGYDPELHRVEKIDSHVLDRWIVSRFASMNQIVVESLDRYDVVSATAAIEAFLDDLSNWYIRSSRRRFWRGGMGEDKVASYSTLYQVLIGVARLVAPFIPFLAEAIHQQLRTPSDPESVHLCRYPQADVALIDQDLEAEMALARRVVSIGHQARNQAQVKVRQPLAQAFVATNLGEKGVAFSQVVLELIRQELNIEAVEAVPDLTPYLKEIVSPNFSSLGPRLGSLAQQAARWIQEQTAAGLRLAMTSGVMRVEIASESVEIHESDVVFKAVVPDGFVLVEDGALQILLDVRLDDTLREKGVVRELIHRIQLLRKEAGFEVTDRVILGYKADAPLANAFSRYQALIASEVLATRVDQTFEKGYEMEKELVIEDSEITLGLSRVIS
jgi:isoleucyl-tRNA synthetase